jgi:hypothetical protein
MENVRPQEESFILEWQENIIRTDYIPFPPKRKQPSKTDMAALIEYPQAGKTYLEKHLV